ncbi:hypothetical protein [Sideroxydans lithotrophicus]|uniref:Outer membrane protein domain-containing protein n=1 Tax=Sideroxydans lithotrophicus (strain ES-1) TaxID=580332 RepID=D5CQ19_SIDLE|nr:hypothetical protein [Sideroxydans lithotrophicus]ADE11183.1 outer membrane protein domain-containing protein [Sideroxydans lithotrophicus ES-1]
MKKQILLAAMLAAMSAPAFAGTGIEARISTLGYGLGLGFQATDSVVARVGFNQFSKTYSTTSGTVNYNGNLKLSSADLLADWHLFGGVTHLTAGLVYNNNKVEMTSVGQYTLNGNPYTGTLNSSVTFNKVAPYLGFGWSGQPKNSGFSFNSDFGVLFQGQPKASVSGSGNAAADATAQADLENSLKNFRYYPVISVGIAYAF